MVPIPPAQSPSVPNPWSPNLALARVLRGGARLSSVILAIGLVWALFGGERGGKVLRPGGILDALRHGHGSGIIGIGLIALIATPVAREAVALTLFSRRGERGLAWLAAAVLALIALSLIIGAR